MVIFFICYDFKFIIRWIEKKFLPDMYHVLNYIFLCQIWMQPVHIFSNYLTIVSVSLAVALSID